MFAKIAAFTTLALAATSVISAPVAETESQSIEKRVWHEGTATYFEVGLGACGWNNVNSDYVIAMNTPQFKGGANCGRWLAITNEQTGITVNAQFVDECPTCDNGSLDMSPSLFQALGANLDQGVFPIKWHFNKKN